MDGTITSSLCSNIGDSLIFWHKNLDLYFREVSIQEWIIMAHYITQKVQQFNFSKNKFHNRTDAMLHKVVVLRGREHRWLRG